MGEETSRKEKYKKRGRPSNKDKFLIPFDLMSLNLFCSYVLSENRNIRKSHLINMRNLFSIIHEDSFKKDQEKLKRVEFIRKGLNARIEQNLNSSFLILKCINGGLVEEDMIDPNNFIELTNDELKWINETVSSCIKNSYMNPYTDRLMELCVKYEAADYRNRGPIIFEIEKVIIELQGKFRKVKVEDVDDVTFSLKDGRMEDVIADVHNQLTNPSNKLLCGMQGLNEMLSGGFESGRVYLLFGLPGEGKSTTLMNLAYQIKKHNKNYKPKDPTKTPCIVFLSMENTVRELIECLFNISTTPDNITNFTIDEVVDKLRKEGELYISDNSPIDIIIKYKPGMSVDTSYLYTLVEELEDDGYECMCMIQDYIKRIRPVDFTGELRIDLGNVINDYKNFAALKDVPVISASQLNRDATKHIDEGRKSNKSDLLRLLGRSNIGESLLILENIDGGFMIAPEWDQEGNKYLGVQKIKGRYKKTSNREHIYQPYVRGSVIKLIEDENLGNSLFRDSLRSDRGEMSPKFNNTKVPSYHSNNIKNVDGEVSMITPEATNENNMFDQTTTRYKQGFQMAAYQHVLFNPIYKHKESGLIKPIIKMERW